ncbi:MAG: hypothetical protein K9W44_06380 [Candidatus Lokiarchaeota archaeon]|nr:hypothetical protein [Candidatus Harpocratesius repetitus]
MKITKEFLKKPSSLYLTKYYRDRLKFRPNRSPGSLRFPYTELPPTHAHYLQKLKVLWEDPDYDYDSSDPPYMKTSGYFDSKRNFKYFNNLNLVGLHRAPSSDLLAHLTRFPELFPETEFIYLEDQFITEFPAWINRLPKLRNLTLALYNITSIPADFFATHPHLTALYLYIPCVVELPDCFNLVPDFRSLILYNTKNLRSLPDSLFHAPKLERIEFFPPTHVGISVPQWEQIHHRDIRIVYCLCSNAVENDKYWNRFLIFSNILRESKNLDRIAHPFVPIADFFYYLHPSTWFTHAEYEIKCELDPFNPMPSPCDIIRTVITRDRRLGRPITLDFIEHVNKYTDIYGDDCLKYDRNPKINLKDKLLKNQRK